MPWPVLITVWIIGIWVGFAPLVYRPHILMFFTAGIFVAFVPGDFGWLRRAGGPCVAALLVILVARLLHLSGLF